MRKIGLALLICLFASGLALAGPNYQPATDVLGAHLLYGRGCPGCHAPHSGARGNGITPAKADTTSGDVALWGQDVSNLVGQTIHSGQADFQIGGYAETLPGNSLPLAPDFLNLTTCLSCHDGNLAKGAMMKGVIYETLASPPYGPSFASIPTFLGNDGNTAGDYLNDHPVGVNAIISCGAPNNWDCTISGAGAINMNTGTFAAQFFTNYGFFVNPIAVSNVPTVMCTTCHNQHLMNVVQVTAANSGQPVGYYQTMFFVRAPYNPLSGTANSNQDAQFCRECHGAYSNEMNNGTAGTIY